jgi:hypothetical protein
MTVSIKTKGAICAALIVAMSGSAPAPVFAKPNELFPKSCRSQQKTGAIVGAIIGGIIGGAVAGDDDRGKGVAAGALIGGLAGSQVARGMSKCERDLTVSLARETARTDHRQSEKAPDSNRRITTEVAGPTFIDRNQRRCKPISVGVAKDEIDEPLVMCEYGTDDWRLQEGSI